MIVLLYLLSNINYSVLSIGVEKQSENQLFMNNDTINIWTRNFNEFSGNVGAGVAANMGMAMFGSTMDYVQRIVGDNKQLSTITKVTCVMGLGGCDTGPSTQDLMNEFKQIRAHGQKLEGNQQQILQRAEALQKALNKMNNHVVYKLQGIMSAIKTGENNVVSLIKQESTQVVQLIDRLRNEYQITTTELKHIGLQANLERKTDTCLEYATRLASAYKEVISHEEALAHAQSLTAVYHLQQSFHRTLTYNTMQSTTIQQNLDLLYTCIGGQNGLPTTDYFSQFQGYLFETNENPKNALSRMAKAMIAIENSMTEGLVVLEYVLAHKEKNLKEGDVRSYVANLQNRRASNIAKAMNVFASFWRAIETYTKNHFNEGTFECVSAVQSHNWVGEFNEHEGQCQWISTSKWYNTGCYHITETNFWRGRTGRGCDKLEEYGFYYKELTHFFGETWSAGSKSSLEDGSLGIYFIDGTISYNAHCFGCLNIEDRLRVSTKGRFFTSMKKIRQCNPWSYCI